MKQPKKNEISAGEPIRTTKWHHSSFSNAIKRGIMRYFQKQPPEVFCRKRCSLRFRKFHKKTPMLESEVHLRMTASVFLKPKLQIIWLTYKPKTSFSALGFTKYFVTCSVLQTLAPPNLCVILRFSHSRFSHTISNILATFPMFCSPIA